MEKKENKKSDELLESREKFVEEIANLLKDKHSKVEGSFILGISGKWGEGKTKFIEKLEKKLESNFDIIKINPWKFGHDKISLLRSFLKKIDKEKQSYKRCPLGSKSRLEDLDFDVTSMKINWNALLKPMPATPLILTLSVLSVVLFLFWDTLKALILAMATPILLLMFQLISIRKSSREITTIDRFDEILSDILKKRDKGLVVFIDDLDRVTPDIARAVLDNTRTFFDQEEISFVVTGDHSVLERHLGREFLPGQDPAEQLDEGRRFLKKIFNLYWRLPLPIEPELSLFIEGLFDKKSKELEKIFPDEDKIKLENYLKKYFESNLRQIERFLELVLFTFRMVRISENDLDNEDNERKKYFEDLKKHPLLLVRVLMIQELCSNLFERILDDPSHLVKIEEIRAEPESTLEPRFDTYLNDKEISLSFKQKRFINRFLLETPRFVKNSSLVVYDLRPFLHYSADVSFGDQRGPSVDSFSILLSQGDPDRIRRALELSGDRKLKDSAKSLRERLDEFKRNADSQNDIDAFTRENRMVFYSLIPALKMLNTTHIAHNIFANALKNIDAVFYQKPQYLHVEGNSRAYRYADNTQKIPIQMKFWDWLDKVNPSYYPEFEKKFDLTLNDLNYINLAEPTNEKPNKFVTKILVNWFNKAYGEGDKFFVLKRFAELSSKLNQEVLIENLNYLENIAQFSLDYAMRNDDFVFLKEVMNLFKKLKAINKLRSNIIRKQSTTNPDIRPLLKLTKAGIIDKADMWNQLLSGDGKVLFQSNLDLLKDDGYSSLAPDADTAEKIRESLNKSIKGAKLAEERMRLGKYLGESLWLWKNLPKTFAGRSLWSPEAFGN